MNDDCVSRIHYILHNRFTFVHASIVHPSNCGSVTTTSTTVTSSPFISVISVFIYIFINSFHHNFVLCLVHNSVGLSAGDYCHTPVPCLLLLYNTSPISLHVSISHFHFFVLFFENFPLDFMFLCFSSF